MKQEPYKTIYVDFTEEELALIDDYAACIGEDRDALLQCIFIEVVQEIIK